MSFKRRTPSKQATLHAGTRVSPSSPSTILVSTGIPSLDDILGGGLPLSCSLAILAPDHHSAYGELVQKYFVSQGLASGQQVCIVDDDGLSFAKDCMWMPVGFSTTTSPVNDEDDENSTQSDERIKIAWRYEGMKHFQTTVSSGNHSSTDDYCHTFDLTCRMPVSVVQSACATKRLVFVEVNSNEDVRGSIRRLLRRIENVLSASPSEMGPMRLCIPSVGCPQWGDVDPAAIMYFLHSLRRLLRQHPHVCASVSLAPHICADYWGGYGWDRKVGWLTDAAISMTGFGANPSLVAVFPSHHGLVQVLKLPAPHTILPGSDKYSMLRGLASSAGANAGSGENNLAFKCTRKRLIIETMHLDLEGGVTERRTTPSSTAISLDAGLADDKVYVSDRGGRSLATVQVELEKAVVIESDSQACPPLNITTTPSKVKKPKKKVAFHSDQPDLYDF
ncbi:Elongator complex protein 4 [Scleroderma yunnanense]